MNDWKRKHSQVGNTVPPSTFDREVNRPHYPLELAHKRFSCALVDDVRYRAEPKTKKFNHIIIVEKLTSQLTHWNDIGKEQPEKVSADFCLVGAVELSYEAPVYNSI